MTARFELNHNITLEQLKGLSDNALQLLLILLDGRIHQDKATAKKLKITLDELGQCFLELSKHNIIKLKNGSEAQANGK
ncbi:hypothetical protein [Pediococcus claussenii]|uniref:hypothetical protein n=1 Tax=Pediococcus claussenii TaxID=187452 RepID=UPI0003170468|nr:hypothetical protein [Pediococcus claussenii]ANZ70082.1 hypothetical protein AYR57_07020 [Pediococcus claussenii]ANZ71897.1 hypothetical protein AYR58_07020 [Pediococcus claussenii]KRN18810.1 hypothetical protein IV79_GL000361 [Pediococcus claussenii]